MSSDELTSLRSALALLRHWCQPLVAESLAPAMDLLRSRIALLQNPLRLYRFYLDYGREGCVEAAFIAHPTFVERVLQDKPLLDLGSILGYYSEVTCRLGVDGTVTELGLADERHEHGYDLLEELCVQAYDNGFADDWNRWVEGLTQYPGMDPVPLPGTPWYPGARNKGARQQT